LREAPGSQGRARTLLADVALAGLAGAVSLAPLALAWLAGLTVLHRDQIGQFAPLRGLIGSALREGRLPLWNPYCATGMPLLAETTHGALHPFSVAAAFLFPSDGLDPLVGLWVAAAAAGAYALARHLGASRPASLVAGLGYGLAGWTLSMTSNLIGLAGAGSVPWVVAGLRRAGRGGDAAGLACGAVVVACGALAGDVQGLAVASLLGLILALEAGGGRGLTTALGAVVIGALLAGVQLVPSWAFLQQTDRILPLPPFEKDQWDLAPWRLIEAVVPGFFTAPGDGMGPAPVYMALGHPTLYTLPLAESVFVGAAMLVLAAAAVRRSRLGTVLAAGALVVGWFAMGRFGGARYLQDLLPVARGWRYGEKYLPGALLCLAALAALGVDHLLADPTRARRWGRLAAAAALPMIAAWLALRLAGADGLLGRLGVPEAGVVRDHLEAGLPHAGLALLAAAGALWLGARGRTKLAAGALVVVVGGAGLAAAPYALRPGSPTARLDHRPLPLEAAPPGPRVLPGMAFAATAPRAGWDAIDQWNRDVGRIYAPNTNAASRVDAFGVDSGLTPLRWRRLIDALGAQLPRAARRYAVTHLVLAAAPRGTSPAAPAPAGIRELEGAQAEQTDADVGATFWRLPHRDWAGFPQEVVSVPGEADAVAAVVELTRRGHRAAVVETAEDLPTTPGRVLRLARGLEQVEVEADAPSEGVLVVNDAAWPGWTATIDGAPVPILVADGLVRAVRFPAGRHTLVMRYRPPEVRRGIAVSALGLALLCGAALLERARRRRGAGSEARGG